MQRMFVFIVALSGSGHHGLFPLVNDLMLGHLGRACHIRYGPAWGVKKEGLNVPTFVHQVRHHLQQLFQTIQ